MKRGLLDGPGPLRVRQTAWLSVHSFPPLEERSTPCLAYRGATCNESKGETDNNQAVTNTAWYGLGCGLGSVGGKGRHTQLLTWGDSTGPRPSYLGP